MKKKFAVLVVAALCVIGGLAQGWWGRGYGYGYGPGWGYGWGPGYGYYGTGGIVADTLGTAAAIGTLGAASSARRRYREDEAYQQGIEQGRRDARTNSSSR